MRALHCACGASGATPRCARVLRYSSAPIAGAPGGRSGATVASESLHRLPADSRLEIGLGDGTLSPSLRGRRRDPEWRPRCRVAALRLWRLRRHPSLRSGAPLRLGADRLRSGRAIGRDRRIGVAATTPDDASSRARAWRWDAVAFVPRTRSGACRRDGGSGPPPPALQGFGSHAPARAIMRKWTATDPGARSRRCGAEARFSRRSVAGAGSGRSPFCCSCLGSG